MAKNLRDLTPAEVIIAEDAMMEFQFAVIDAMREKNISQVELAEKLGISRARVSQMLSSEANPTLKVVARTLAALDLETRYCRKIKRPDFSYDWNVIPHAWDADTKATKPVWHNDNGASQYANINSIRKAA